MASPLPIPRLLYLCHILLVAALLQEVLWPAGRLFGRQFYDWSWPNQEAESYDIEDRLQVLNAKIDNLTEKLDSLSIHDSPSDPRVLPSTTESLNRVTNKLEQLERLIDAPPIHSSSPVHRENAALVTLARNSDLWELVETIRSLEDRFNHQFGYDWVFLNDKPFTEEFQTTVAAMVSGRALFGIIPTEHWSYPEFIDQQKAAENRESLAAAGVVYGSSESYRHMCRFESGFFFRHPLLEPYRYYWRVEPGVRYFCDVSYDVFRYMRESGKRYGFAISMYEYEATIPTLWETAKRFFAEHPEFVASNNLLDFVSDDGGETYNLCHFWSNFEIADMELWRSPGYRAYFDYLDQTGGFFYERWGDAPVHSIAAAFMLNKDEVHFFNDIGYFHGPYLQCPSDNQYRLQHKCSCNPDLDFTFQDYSCTGRFYQFMGWQKQELK